MQFLYLVLLLLPFILPSAQAVPSRNARDAQHPSSVNFPGDAEESTNHGIRFEGAESSVRFRSKDEPSCHVTEGQKEYCEDDAEYNDTARRRFDQLMQGMPISNSFTDVLNETIVEPFRPDLRIPGNFITEQTLCESTETIIYPKRGKTQENDWVFILNQGPVRQGIKVEKCLFESKPCRLGGGPLENTFCRQKYIYKKLLTMDSRGNNIVSESVYMPSCCSCYASNDFISPKTGSGIGKVK